MMFKKTLLTTALTAALLSALLPYAAQADDSLFGPAPGGGSVTASDDGLFGSPASGQSNGLISDSAATGVDLAKEMLSGSDTVVWRGEIEYQAVASKLQTDAELPGADTSTQINHELSGNLTLDMRPDADTRLLLKGDYRLSEEKSSITLREGFADFTVDDQLFVRAGLQTLHWGVGYFFSPADVLSDNAINAADPDADRQGTLAVRAHLPRGTDNYYAYLLPDSNQNAVQAGVKAEWLLGGHEYGLGLVHQYQGETSVSLTASWPTRWSDFFGEYVLTHGVETQALDPLGHSTARDERWLPQLTLGSRGSDTDNDDFKLSYSLQYLYNGHGYADALWLHQGQDQGQWQALSSQYQLEQSQRGQHYLAGSVAWSEMLQTDFTASALVLAGLTDDSQWIKTSLRYQPLDFAALELAVDHTLGQTGSDYAPMGDATRYSLTLTLDSGAQ